MVDFSHREVPGVACIVLSVLAFLFDVISFFSFNWIESYPEYNSEFTKLGLWAACLNGYRHPEDYVSKDYYGCWFIYWMEYKYIRDWLTPGWFISTQVFAVICLFCNTGALIAVLLRRVLKKNETEEDVQKRRRSDIAPIIMQLTATLMYMYIVTWFGVMSKDRNWLPRPDHNRVGWSFALAVLAGFCSAYAFIFLSIEYCMTHWREGPMPKRNGLSGHELGKEEMVPLNTEPDYTVSAAGASAKHRDQVDRMQQQRARGPGSTYSGGPKPAASYSRLAGGPSQSQLAMQPTLTDSTV